MKLNVMNYTESGDALFYEISEFYSAIDPVKTTSIRKKDQLTIVLHKKDGTKWPSLTPVVQEIKEEDEESAKESEEKDKVGKLEHQRIGSLSPEKKEERETGDRIRHVNPGLKRSPEQVNLDSNPSGSASRKSGSAGKQEFASRGERKSNDPYFDEISKDFKDLRSSKEALVFPITSPSKEKAPQKSPTPKEKKPQTVAAPKLNHLHPHGAHDPIHGKDDTLHLSFDLLEVQMGRDGNMANLSDSSHALRGKMREMLGGKMNKPSTTKDPLKPVLKNSPPSTKGFNTNPVVTKGKESKVQLKDYETSPRSPSSDGKDNQVTPTERAKSPSSAKNQKTDSPKQQDKKEPKSSVSPQPSNGPKSARAATQISHSSSTAIASIQNHVKKLAKPESSQHFFEQAETGSNPQISQPQQAVSQASPKPKPAPLAVTTDQKQKPQKTELVKKYDSREVSKINMKMEELLKEDIKQKKPEEVQLPASINDLLNTYKLASVLKSKDFEDFTGVHQDRLTPQEESRLNERIIELLSDRIISEKENRLHTEIQIEKLTNQNKKQIQALEKMLKKSK